MKRDDAVAEIQNEYQEAIKKFSTFNSQHEGFAVLREEVDELWDNIKANTEIKLIKAEAIQVGAMAMRFLTDCC